MKCGHAFNRNLVLGFENLADHHNIPIYAGAIVGPVANRISHGKVAIAGQTYHMPLNENGITTLHSGDQGLHAQTWQILTQSTDSVTFQCRLQAGAVGLLGNRTFTVRYTLSGLRLMVELSAVTDHPTAFNLAAHPYWNLDSGPDVSAHQLTVHADHILPVDHNNIPTGAIAPVAGTPFDFRKPRPIPIGQGLDHNFCLSRQTAPAPRLACTLKGRSGTSLTIRTTAPGLQVYDGAFLPDMPGALDGKRDLRPYGAIALEPQSWPDAPNHPAFPSISFGPDKAFRQETVFDVTLP